MNRVTRNLRDIIRSSGPITFAQFMDEALYSPFGGYYSTSGRVGAMGDYFTSPSAHPLFGALIAIQLEQMWELLDRPPCFTVLELGSGSGILIRDVLAYSAYLDRDFSDSLLVAALDRNPPNPLGQGQINWVVGQNVPFKGVVGCILSNELLDAFPVHRFQLKRGEVFEIYVGFDDQGFHEILGEPSTPGILQRLHGVLEAIPEAEFQGEINLYLDPWLSEVVSTLERGFLLSIDYGGMVNELYTTNRPRGTLRCFYQHILSDDPYRRVGEQDITAHTDFSALMNIGRKYGLDTFGYTTQREFLQNLGGNEFVGELNRVLRSYNEILANRMGMLHLMDPDGLGGFKVLLQGKGVQSSVALHGFRRSDSLKSTMLKRDPPFPIPLRDPDVHMPLLEGRYPQYSDIPENLWPWLDQSGSGGV